MQLSLETQQAGCLTPRPQGSRPLPGQPRWAMCGCLGRGSLPRAPTPPEQLAPLGAAGSHPAPSASPWDAASSAVHPLVPLPCCSPVWRQLSPSGFLGSCGGLRPPGMCWRSWQHRCAWEGQDGPGAGVWEAGEVCAWQRARRLCHFIRQLWQHKGQV